MSAIPKFPGLGSMPPSAPSHSPLDLEDGERIVHINLMGDGADTASMLFIVNDKNGEVFQVTCDKEGVITGRAQVGGGNQDWPKMLNSSGELVPFQSYFIGEDGNLYGNVLEAGADPTTIEDPDLSTWVNLGPAENASNKYEESNLPKEVPFVLLSDGTGVAIPQDYALPVENELAQDFGAQVDPNNGNIPFDLGSVSLENTDGVPSEYTLPVNTNGQPFEKYCFVDIGDDDIRLYR